MFGGLMKFLGGSKQMHDIVGGNTLSGIGQQYGQSQEQLMSMNPQITNPDQIRAGQQMQVGSTPGIMGRIGYGEGQWAPGKFAGQAIGGGVGMAGSALQKLFQSMGSGGQGPVQGGGQQQGGRPPGAHGPLMQSGQFSSPRAGFMDRMMKGEGGNPGLMSQEGLEAMTGHLNKEPEDFTQYMTEVQTPANTWGEQSRSNVESWY